MDTMDNAAKLIKAFALLSAKKTSRSPAPDIPPAKPVSLGAENGQYSVGFASSNLTPADLLRKTYWMAGYNVWKKIEGFRDPLTANAMWIDCGGKNGIVLLSLDLVGLTGYEISQIRDSLKDFCEVSGCVHVVVSCTHTHAGIDTMGYWGPLPKNGKDKTFMQTVAVTVKKLCWSAFKNKKTGKLFYGNISAPELNDRWRQPYFTNDILHRFRFVPDDGSDETWYVNYGAHPNTLGGRNKDLSADYPCYMRREINKVRKTNVLFSVSTIGATDIGKVAENDLDRTILGGQMLGKKLFEISNEKELKPELTILAQKFVMPIENTVLASANALGIFNTIKCSSGSSLGIGFISEIDYIKIGGVQILTMPGEMFSELVYPGGYCVKETSAADEDPSINPEPISSIFEDPGIIIFGVTNDMAGYAIAPNDFVLHKTQPFISRGTDRFGRSHYHETNSCGINTAQTIADTCRKIKTTLDQT